LLLIFGLFLALFFVPDEADLAPFLEDSEKHLFRPVVLAHQLSGVDKRPSGGLRRLLEIFGLSLALFFVLGEADLAPFLADSEKPLSRPVVLAQRLPGVDKRPSGGLRTTVEVVDVNRALVGSKIVPPWIFFSLTHS
jgi:hypothetical protein